MELKVKINGQEHTLEGHQAEAVQEYSKLTQESANYALAKKETDKKIKKFKATIDQIFTESEKRFNDSNTLDIMSLTGNAVAESFTVTSKAAPKKELISKKALMSLLADGLQDGWISINSAPLLEYLRTQQFLPGLELEQLEEKVTALDFTTILDKTRTLPKDKEETNIKQENIGD